MSEILDEVQKDIADRYVSLFELWGLNPTMVKVYLALFFSTKPMGLQEIAQKTGYSVSTICTTMDILERLVDVRKFKQPGSKKIYYECQHNIMIAQKKKIIESKRLMESFITILTESEEKLKDETDSEVVTMRNHISTLRHDYEKFSKVITYMEKGLHLLGKE